MVCLDRTQAFSSAADSSCAPGKVPQRVGDTPFLTQPQRREKTPRKPVADLPASVVFLTPSKQDEGAAPAVLHPPAPTAAMPCCPTTAATEQPSTARNPSF